MVKHCALVITKLSITGLFKCYSEVALQEQIPQGDERTEEEKEEGKDRKIARYTERT